MDVKGFKTIQGDGWGSSCGPQLLDVYSSYILYGKPWSHTSGWWGVQSRQKCWKLLLIYDIYFYRFLIQIVVNIFSFGTFAKIKKTFSCNYLRNTGIQSKFFSSSKTFVTCIWQMKSRSTF